MLAGFAGPGPEEHQTGRRGVSPPTGAGVGGRGEPEKAGGECRSRRREFRGRASPDQLAARPARGHTHLSVGGVSPEEMPVSGRFGLEDVAPLTNPGAVLTPRMPASVGFCFVNCPIC